MVEDTEIPTDPGQRELYAYLAACREAQLGNAPAPPADHLDASARLHVDRLRGLMHLLDEAAPRLSAFGSTLGPAQTDVIAGQPQGAAPRANRPERLGQYLIRRERGRGGMGIVYEGWDSTLQRPVAVKMIHAG